VGYQYLRRLVKDRAASTELMERLTEGIQQFLKDYVNSQAGAQVERVAKRFALIGQAGELATAYGLTGWEKGEARKAAATCLDSWMNVFGDRGNREERQLLEQVRSFLEANGSSRFESMHGGDSQRIINRCGFYHVTEFEYDKDGNLQYGLDGPLPKKGGLREYLLQPNAFRYELCAGFDYKFAVRVLKAHGWLEPGKDKSSQLRNLPGMRKTRVYVIGPKVWEDAE
jgi:uncharacterized protein (DUF927 family)